jgi:hypothetical protein
MGGEATLLTAGSRVLATIITGIGGSVPRLACLSRCATLEVQADSR